MARTPSIVWNSAEKEILIQEMLRLDPDTDGFSAALLHRAQRLLAPDRMRMNVQTMRVPSFDWVRDGLYSARVRLGLIQTPVATAATGPEQRPVIQLFSDQELLDEIAHRMKMAQPASAVAQVKAQEPAPKHHKPAEPHHKPAEPHHKPAPKSAEPPAKLKLAQVLPKILIVGLSKPQEVMARERLRGLAELELMENAPSLQRMQNLVAKVRPAPRGQYDLVVLTNRIDGDVYDKLGLPEGKILSATASVNNMLNDLHGMLVVSSSTK